MLAYGLPAEWSSLKKLIFLKASILKGSSLPKEYRELLGFSMNNDCYFEITDFKLKGSDTLRFSFSASVACNILGCYTTGAAQTNYSLYVATSSGKYMRYNGGTANSTITANEKYNVVMTPNGATGLGAAVTWEPKDFTAASDLCIGTTSTGATSSKLVGSLYGRIIVDGRLNLIPCERIADNVLGYYDSHGKKFYEPAAGTPTSLGIKT